MRATEVADVPLLRDLAVVSALARPHPATVRGVLEDLCVILGRELAYASQDYRRQSAHAAARQRA